MPGYYQPVPPGQKPFIYVNGAMPAINDLLVNNPGWFVYEANAINDHGQIASTGTITVSGIQETHALLLN